MSEVQLDIKVPQSSNFSQFFDYLTALSRVDISPDYFDFPPSRQHKAAERQ